MQIKINYYLTVSDIIAYYRYQLLSMAPAVMLVAKGVIEVYKSSFKVPIVFL